MTSDSRDQGLRALRKLLGQRQQKGLTPVRFEKHMSLTSDCTLRFEKEALSQGWGGEQRRVRSQKSTDSGGFGEAPGELWRT